MYGSLDEQFLKVNPRSNENVFLTVGSHISYEVHLAG